MDIQRKPLYRVHRDLSYSTNIIPRNSLHFLDRCSGEAIEKLKESGAISEAVGPPLAQLPGWSRRSARMARLGIELASDLLCVDANKLGKELHVKPDTVSRWQNEVMEWLVAKPERRR